MTDNGLRNLKFFCNLRLCATLDYALQYLLDQRFGQFRIPTLFASLLSVKIVVTTLAQRSQVSEIET